LSRKVCSDCPKGFRLAASEEPLGNLLQSLTAEGRVPQEAPMMLKGINFAASRQQLILKLHYNQ